MTWERAETNATDVARRRAPIAGWDDADRALRGALFRMLDLITSDAPDNGRGSHAREAVRVAVRNFAMARRRRGAKPETTLIELKQKIRDVRSALGAHRSIIEPEELHAFIDDAIRWCIEDYYRGDRGKVIERR